MENFGARGDGDATSVSLEKLAQADIYVLLVAWRYGFVPANQETLRHPAGYQAALAHKLPLLRLSRRPRDRRPDHDSPQFPAASATPTSAPELDAFRAELLKTHILGTFAVSPTNSRPKLSPISANIFWASCGRRRRATWCSS